MGVSCGGGSRISCWEWPEERVHWQVQTLAGHSGTVWSVTFSLDGTRIVSGSDDKLVKIWDVETGDEVNSFVKVRWGGRGDGGISRGF